LTTLKMAVFAPYTEGKSENRNRGEPRGFAKHAQAEAQILHEGFDEMSATRVARFLLDIFEAAELYQGLAASFTGIHPCRNVVGGLLLDVEAKLRIELRIELGSVK
jgi:hypothetical protein